MPCFDKHSFVFVKQNTISATVSSVVCIHLDASNFSKNKRIFINVSNTTANKYFSYTTINKSIIANAGNTVRNSEFRIPICVYPGKCTITNTGHTIFNNDLSDLVIVHIRIPRCLSSAIIIHITRTGNSQHTIICQHPGQVVATGAVLHHTIIRCITQRTEMLFKTMTSCRNRFQRINKVLIQIIITTVNRGVIKVIICLQASFCASSRRSHQAQKMNILDIIIRGTNLIMIHNVFPFLSGSQIINIRQGIASIKISIFPKICYRSWNQQIVQAVTIVECIAIQPLQRARQGNCLDLLHVLKSIGLNIGNAIQNLNTRHLINICIPRIHRTAIRVFHNACARDSQLSAFYIQLPCHIVSPSATNMTANGTLMILIPVVAKCLTLRRAAKGARFRICASCILPCMVAVHHPGDRSTIILHHVTRPGCITLRIIRNSGNAIEYLFVHSRSIA